MTRPLLVIRPEPGNRATLDRARALGLDATGLPLFEVRPHAWACPEGAFDALLITSANAIRHAGAALANLVHLPVWAVGTKSAAAAQHAGFAVVRTGSAGLADLLAGAPPARLLHLCGADRIPAPHWPGGSISAVPVYESVALNPIAALTAHLKKRPVVLLHSPRAARDFAALTAQCGAEKQHIAVVAISAATADAAGSGWEKLAIGRQTGDEALLDAARLWCGAQPETPE